MLLRLLGTYAIFEQLNILHFATGGWLLAAGCWLLPANCWPLAAAYTIIIAGRWLTFAACQSPYDDDNDGNGPKGFDLNACLLALFTLADDTPTVAGSRLTASKC
uniref:Uncharacterized protein n=1 Tax=Glossina austeni TaxID=7395 RepID=A0A1A9V9D3_GLOAU